MVNHFALDSEPILCILPMQDVLGLRQEGRMNTPSTIGSPNWEWKLKNFKEVEKKMDKLAVWIRESGR